MKPAWENDHEVTYIFSFFRWRVRISIIKGVCKNSEHATEVIEISNKKTQHSTHIYYRGESPRWWCLDWNCEWLARTLGKQFGDETRGQVTGWRLEKPWTYVFGEHVLV